MYMPLKRDDSSSVIARQIACASHGWYKLPYWRYIAKGLSPGWNMHCHLTAYRIRIQPEDQADISELLV